MSRPKPKEETMKITNTTQALQGVPTKSGSTDWVPPGQTKDVDVTDRWFEKHSKRTMFTIEGVAPIKQTQQLAELNNSASVDVTRYASQILELEGKLEESDARATRYEQELTTSAARVSELETEVARLVGELQLMTTNRDNLQAQIDVAGGGSKEEIDPEVAKFEGLEARHKGAGAYSIFNAAGDELVQKLTKDQADEFSGKSRDEQVEYVKSIVNG